MFKYIKGVGVYSYLLLSHHLESSSLPPYFLKLLLEMYQMLLSFQIL